MQLHAPGVIAIGRTSHYASALGLFLVADDDELGREELKQLFDLTGKIALVTGGSRGLGLEMAEGLAEAGASLMLLARREQWLAPAVESLKKRGFRAEGGIS